MHMPALTAAKYSIWKQTEHEHWHMKLTRTQCAVVHSCTLCIYDSRDNKMLATELPTNTIIIISHFINRKHTKVGKIPSAKWSKN